MTREFLKRLGIEDKDTVDSIMAENGRDINAEKDKYADHEDIKKQLAAANKQIEEFGKLDYEELKKTADDYKAKFEQSERDAAEKLSKLRFDNALDAALTAEKPKNVKMLRAMIEQDKLKFSDTGNKIIGLDEQLKAIRKDNAFLFSETTEEPPKPFFGGKSGGGNGTMLQFAEITIYLCYAENGLYRNLFDLQTESQTFRDDLKFVSLIF